MRRTSTAATTRRCSILTTSPPLAIPLRPQRRQSLPTPAAAFSAQKLLKGHTVCCDTMTPILSILTLIDVAGEYVRSDIRDGEAGIEFVLDTQVLDVSTCEPVTNALVEIWRMSSPFILSVAISPPPFSTKTPSSSLISTGPLTDITRRQLHRCLQRRCR